MKWLSLTFVICISLAASISMASLGDIESSADTDARVFTGTSKVEPHQNFTVHDIKTSGGVDIKEYAGADGRIFAVTWRGGVQPDLKVLLGGYQSEYAQGLTKAQKHHGHGHARLQTANIVVERGGHMRDVRGRAFIPAKIPAGSTEGDIQ